MHPVRLRRGTLPGTRCRSPRRVSTHDPALLAGQRLARARIRLNPPGRPRQRGRLPADAPAPSIREQDAIRRRAPDHRAGEDESCNSRSAPCPTCPGCRCAQAVHALHAAGFHVQLAGGAEAGHPRRRRARSRRRAPMIRLARHAMSRSARRPSRDALAPRRPAHRRVEARCRMRSKRITDDSRAVAPQARSFIAVRGAERDGHTFLAVAAERGAVDRDRRRPRRAPTLPALVVSRHAPRRGDRRRRLLLRTGPPNRCASSA